jgi:hypothetical protein
MNYRTTEVPTAQLRACGDSRDRYYQSYEGEEIELGVGFFSGMTRKTNKDEQTSDRTAAPRPGHTSMFSSRSSAAQSQRVTTAPESGPNTLSRRSKATDNPDGTEASRGATTTSYSRRSAVRQGPSERMMSQTSNIREILQKIYTTDELNDWTRVNDWTRGIITVYTPTTIERNDLLTPGIQYLIREKCKNIWKQTGTEPEKQGYAVQILFTCLMGIVFFIQKIAPAETLPDMYRKLLKFQTNLDDSIEDETPLRLLAILVGFNAKTGLEAVEAAKKTLTPDYMLLVAVAQQLLLRAVPRTVPTNACAACTCVDCGKRIR